MVLSTCLWTPEARAVDTVSFSAGSGDETRIAAEVSLDWDWPWRWHPSASVTLGGSWNLALAWWRWKGAAVSDDAFDVSFTPMFRLDMQSPVYFEAGLGVHLLSNAAVSGKLSTSFEFCETLGIGFRLKPSLDIGYRFRHLSNGGIRQPNGGINAHFLRIGWHY